MCCSLVLLSLLGILSIGMSIGVSIGMSILCHSISSLSNLCGLSILALLHILLTEEVSEEGKHGEHVDEEEPYGEHGEILWWGDENHVGGLDEVETELNELELSDVLSVVGRLVPSRSGSLRLLWCHGAPQVVSIHDDMDQGVQTSTPIRASTRAVADDDPPDEEYRRMVIHMEECDLATIGFDSHEESVCEFRNLGCIEYPHHSGHR